MEAVINIEENCETFCRISVYDNMDGCLYFFITLKKTLVFLLENIIFTELKNWLDGQIQELAGEWNSIQLVVDHEWCFPEVDNGSHSVR